MLGKFYRQKIQVKLPSHRNKQVTIFSLSNSTHIVQTKMERNVQYMTNYSIHYKANLTPGNSNFQVYKNMCNSI